MDGPPSKLVLEIPEILVMVISFLDPTSLKNASLVCKQWNHHYNTTAWRQLIIPHNWFDYDLSTLWPVLDRRGAYFRAVALKLTPQQRSSRDFDMEHIQTQLGRILSKLPNLERLEIQLPSQLSSNVLGVLVKHPPPRLEHLDTDLLCWDPVDLENLLRACPTLKRLAGHDFSGKELLAIAATQPNLVSIECTRPRFDDGELVAFMSHYPDLRQLSVSLHQFLSSKALIGIAARCSKLEHLNFHFCLNLWSSGFQAIFSASPNLRTLDLGLTEVKDGDIALVAAQCTGLESLKLPFCSNITDQSISEIVYSCRALRHLDISWCNSVLLTIFDKERPWVCNRLRYLDISGIHSAYAVEAPVVASLLPAMYQQLGLLTYLRSLRLSGFWFPLHLLDLGRPELTKLFQLETFDISKTTHLLSWEDIVAIGNMFPRLSEFVFRNNDVLPQVPVEEREAIESAQGQGQQSSSPLEAGQERVQGSPAVTEKVTIEVLSADVAEDSKTPVLPASEPERNSDKEESQPSAQPPSKPLSPKDVVLSGSLLSVSEQATKTIETPIQPQKISVQETTSTSAESLSVPRPSSEAAANANGDTSMVEVIRATLISGLEISYRVGDQDEEEDPGADFGMTAWGIPSAAW